MRKYSLCAVLALTACLASSGCQLARDDGGIASGADRFIGISIRMEKLDDFLEDADEAWPEFEEADLDEEMTEDGAVVIMDALWDDDPEPAEAYPLGENYLAAPVRGEGDDYIVDGGAVGPWLTDGSTQMNIGDEGEEIILEATIYMIADEQFNRNVGNTVLYIDDVYQRPDGSIYVLREKFHGISGNIDGYSQTRSAESVTTINGKAQKNKVSCTVHFRQADELIWAELLEFDENHALTARHKLTRPDGDENIDVQVSGSTAYAVIEKTVIDRYTRQNKIERAVVSAPFDGETTRERLFFKGEHSVAEARYVVLSAAR